MKTKMKMKMKMKRDFVRLLGFTAPLKYIVDALMLPFSLFFNTLYTGPAADDHHSVVPNEFLIIV